MNLPYSQLTPVITPVMTPGHTCIRPTSSVISASELATAGAASFRQGGNTALPRPVQLKTDTPTGPDRAPAACTSEQRVQQQTQNCEHQEGTMRTKHERLGIVVLTCLFAIPFPSILGGLD